MDTARPGRKRCPRTMRTQHEPDETDAFEAAKELLVRRCAGWAHQHELTADPFVLSAALDFRHEGGDGRLAYWSGELARDFLLMWLPRKVSASVEEVSDAPESLRTLVHYLDHAELTEMGSESPADIEVAITSASTEFASAMADERNFGLAKFWIMTAIEAGIDTTDAAAMNRFVEQARSGDIEYDGATLQHIMERHLSGDEATPPRAPTMPPVSLPPEDELAEFAENSLLVGQLRALVEWLGRDGRALTGTGQLKLADARELVTLLNTTDTIDPVIGDRKFRTQSSAELAHLGLIVAWAKKARLVRVVKNRLVPIAKAKPLLRDATALWNRAFDAIVELGDEIVVPPWYLHGAGMLNELFRDIVPDLLRTLYGIPEPFPVVRLQHTVWLTCQAVFAIDGVAESQQRRWRESTYADVWRLLRALSDLDAVELTTGTADSIFSADLDDEHADVAPLPPEMREELRAALDPETGPTDLVRLTAVANARVRSWLLDEGRSAPLVGELTEATPAQLLGAVYDHHLPETGRAEIDYWLAAHDEDGLQQLIDAVRRCPFRSRAAAMLDVLAASRPDSAMLLRRVRSDDVLGPLAVQRLFTDDLLGQDDLTEREHVQALTEHLLQALEMVGPEAVQEQLLTETSKDRALETVTAAAHSGHPDTTGIEELVSLVAEPLQWGEHPAS